MRTNLQQTDSNCFISSSRSMVLWQMDNSCTPVHPYKHQQEHSSVLWPKQTRLLLHRRNRTTTNHSSTIRSLRHLPKPHTIHTKPFKSTNPIHHHPNLPNMDNPHRTHNPQHNIPQRSPLHLPPPPTPPPNSKPPPIHLPIHPPQTLPHPPPPPPRHQHRPSTLHHPDPPTRRPRPNPPPPAHPRSTPIHQPIRKNNRRHPHALPLHALAKPLNPSRHTHLGTNLRTTHRRATHRSSFIPRRSGPILCGSSSLVGKAHGLSGRFRGGTDIDRAIVAIEACVFRALGRDYAGSFRGHGISRVLEGV